MKSTYIDQPGRGIRAGIENETACFPMETPEQEERRFIQELCRIKGELGRTGRYGDTVHSHLQQAKDGDRSTLPPNSAYRLCRKSEILP